MNGFAAFCFFTDLFSSAKDDSLVMINWCKNRKEREEIVQKVCKVICVLLLGCLLLKSIPLYTLAEEIEFRMEVGQTGQKSETYGVGQKHRWFIRIKLSPEWSGITILQTLDPALGLDTASVNLKILRENNEQILMQMEEHYTITAGSVFVENGLSDRFCITLTPEGLDFLTEYMTWDSELVVSYVASINTSAQMGEQILGSAQLTLMDQVGKKYIFLSEKAVVATGGFHFKLTDQRGNPVKGGKFMLAREATQEELDAPGVMIEVLDTGDDPKAVVFERFYISGDMAGETHDTVVTNESGEALCYGLSYGVYYLVQMYSEYGNILPSKPLTVWINEVSHITEEDGWKDGQGKNADNTVIVVQKEMDMPSTGGPGTVPFTVSGTMVILCACMLLWYNRKQKYLI